MLRKTLKLAKEKSDTQPENVGWPTDDTRLVDLTFGGLAPNRAHVIFRPPVKANRAGTRGFRAPEVLLKCTVQTPGIFDIFTFSFVLIII